MKDRLISTIKFQELIYDYTTTDKIDKWFNTTIFSEKEYRDELKMAMINGMCLAVMLTTQCQSEETPINIEETQLTQVTIDGKIIHNLPEAADWLRDSGICDCYNVWYEEFGEKGTSDYRECIFIEPTRDHEDLVGDDICDLKEFYEIAMRGYIE